MLESILSREDCAKCQYCCTFCREEIWANPVIDLVTLEKLKLEYPEAKFKIFNDCAALDFEGLFKTDDPKEEPLCWFNHGKGCLLGDDKPFECKLWPFRVMHKDNRLVIALCSNCPVVSSKPLSDIEKLLDDGLADTMLEHAKSFPASVKDYRKNYVVLRVLE